VPEGNGFCQFEEVSNSPGKTKENYTKPWNLQTKSNDTWCQQMAVRML